MLFLWKCSFACIDLSNLGRTTNFWLKLFDWEVRKIHLLSIVDFFSEAQAWPNTCGVWPNLSDLEQIEEMWLCYKSRASYFLIQKTFLNQFLLSAFRFYTMRVQQLKTDKPGTIPLSHLKKQKILPKIQTFLTW